MMKSLMGLFLFCTAALAQAEICTVAIHDNYGFDYDHFTSESYSIEAACGEATWNCQQRLSYYQSYGRYYDAYCIVKSVSSPNYPIPYPPSYPPRYPTPRYPDPREPQYPRYPREPHDPRFPREPREPNFPREPREPNFPREPRGPGGPGGPRRPR